MRTALAELISDYVQAREGEIADFLSSYVRVASVNPNRGGGSEDACGEAVAQRWLAEQVESLRIGDASLWEVEAGRPNLIWTVGPKGDETGVVFNGHADTVGVSREQESEWTGDPFSGDIAGGRVFGRGVADMKAGTVAFVWASKAVRDLEVGMGRRAVMTVCSGEESAESKLGVLSVVARGISGPVWIVAEPTDLRMCPVGLGIVYFRLVVEGKSSHVSNRRGSLVALRRYEGRTSDRVPEGVDAASWLFELAQALNVLERRLAEERNPPLVPEGVGRGICPIRVQGGHGRAEMIDRCSIEYAVSLNPGDSSTGTMRRIHETIDDVVRESRWLQEFRPRVEWPIVHDPIEPLLWSGDSAPS